MARTWTVGHVTHVDDPEPLVGTRRHAAVEEALDRKAAHGDRQRLLDATRRMVYIQHMSDSTHRLASKIAGSCLCSKARRLVRVLTRTYNEALRPHGLTAAQLNLLVGIELMEKASASELGRRLEIERSTLSRNLGLLQEHGWIRVAETAARQQKSVSLTASGRKKLLQAYGAWEEAQESARRILGEPTYQSIALLPTTPARGRST